MDSSGVKTVWLVLVYSDHVLTVCMIQSFHSNQTRSVKENVPLLISNTFGQYLQRVFILPFNCLCLLLSKDD